MSGPLWQSSAVQVADQVRKGELSAVRMAEAVFDRIDAVDGEAPDTHSNGSSNGKHRAVQAFITVTRERALEQAAEVDRKIEAGEDPGLLAGVPASVKDIFCVKGVNSTAASRILENFVAPYTATPVRRMEQAGAVILGKVNLDEFTFGSSNESSAFSPTPANPWDLTRVPGGSSGGSAAALAAGEGALSLATDTAGSIRQPAAFCGVVGVKPTYGRVSRYGQIAFASSLDCPGPMARNISDAALMLRVIAGADPRDATAAQVPVEDYLASLEQGVEGMRIGLSPDFFHIRYPDSETGELIAQELDPLMVERVEAAASALEMAGADIVRDVPMPNVHYAIPAYFAISRVEAASNLHRYDGVKYGLRSEVKVQDLTELYRRSRGEGFGEQAKLRILMGMYVSAEQYESRYYEKALRVRTLIRRDFERIFDAQGEYRLDCLLAPTTPTTAFPLQSVYGDSVLMQYADLLTVPANHAGVPALSMPSGFDSDGLPVGIQIMAADYSESVLFRVGRAFELATQSEPWRDKIPNIG